MSRARSVDWTSALKVTKAGRSSFFEEEIPPFSLYQYALTDWKEGREAPSVVLSMSVREPRLFHDWLLPLA